MDNGTTTIDSTNGETAPDVTVANQSTVASVETNQQEVQKQDYKDEKSAEDKAQDDAALDVLIARADAAERDAQEAYNNAPADEKDHFREALDHAKHLSSEVHLLKNQSRRGVRISSALIAQLSVGVTSVTGDVKKEESAEQKDAGERQQIAIVRAAHAAALAPRKLFHPAPPVQQDDPNITTVVITAPRKHHDAVALQQPETGIAAMATLVRHTEKQTKEFIKKAVHWTAEDTQTLHQSQQMMHQTTAIIARQKNIADQTVVAAGATTGGVAGSLTQVDDEKNLFIEDNAHKAQTASKLMGNLTSSVLTGRWDMFVKTSNVVATALGYDIAAVPEKFKNSVMRTLTQTMDGSLKGAQHAEHNIMHSANAEALKHTKLGSELAALLPALQKQMGPNSWMDADHNGRIDLDEIGTMMGKNIGVKDLKDVHIANADDLAKYLNAHKVQALTPGAAHKAATPEHTTTPPAKHNVATVHSVPEHSPSTPKAPVSTLHGKTAQAH